MSATFTQVFRQNRLMVERVVEDWHRDAAAGLLQQRKALIHRLNNGEVFEKPVCKACGSDEVSLDATAHWNQATQQWELMNTGTSFWCRSCNKPLLILSWSPIQP